MTLPILTHRHPASTSPSPAPSLSTALTRRQALQLAAAAVLTATLGSCGSDDERGDPSFWAAITAAAQAQDPALTTAAATAELDTAGGPADIRRPTPALRRTLHLRITEDFAHGRTMLVAGWLLARTEVLAAIVAVADR